MRFSTKAEYGLKAIVNMAQCYPEQKTTKELAQEENISQKYLERLLGKLRTGGLIDSTKGKSGGYVLARDPKKILVGEIIELLDGDISPMRCVGKFCASQNKCPSSLVWLQLGEQIHKTLYKIKLSDLVK